MACMSEESSIVTRQHFEYLAARTRQEDAFLRDLKAAAERAGIPAIHIAPEQASFVQILLRARGARDVVEVGTLAGYSAIAMARALPEDGRVTTIELEPRHAVFAREWIAKSDVAGRVAVVEGRAADVLAALADGSADAMFIDADKASYPRYLDEAMRILRPHGLVMVDNAFAFGQLFVEHPTDREVPGVKAFNDYIPRIDGLQSVIVPLGDGMWVGVRT
jgi:predicted O-methyltransferase YrrM